MEINEAGLNIIKEFEANPKTGTFYDKAYQDEEGVWTIGWGTIRWDMKTPVQRGQTITAEEADHQLRVELIRIYDAINTAIKVPLNENEFSALCSMVYNIGTGWMLGGVKNGKRFGPASLVGYLNSGKKHLVVGNMLQFKRGAVTGKSYNGLLRRRKMEAALFTTPVADEHPTVAVDIDGAEVHETMPQAVTVERQGALEVAKESWTIRGAAMALLASVYQFWTWLFGTAVDAGKEIVAIKTATGPFDALFSSLKIDLAVIAIGAIAIGSIIAIIRRLKQD